MNVHELEERLLSYYRDREVVAMLPDQSGYYIIEGSSLCGGEGTEIPIRVSIRLGRFVAYKKGEKE